MIARTLVVRCTSIALLCVCLAWSAGAQVASSPPPPAGEEPSAGIDDDDPPDPFAGSLRYGYIAGTGRVAIDPNLVYAVCRDTSTLIVHAGQEEAAANALSAIRRADGSWLLPSGNAVVPQIASDAIVTGPNTVAVDAPELTPVGAEQVALVMADPALACTVSLERWQCTDKNKDGGQLSCSGCLPKNGRREHIGPARFTKCKWTNNENDRCEMNGQIIVCIIKQREQDYCKEAVLKTTVKSFQQCTK